MIMNPILEERKKSKVSVCDIMQYSQFAHQGKCENDVLYVVYYNEYGEKKLNICPNPEFDIYFTKPEYRYEWNKPREYVPADKVFPVTVTRKTLLPEIYREICKDTTGSTSAKYFRAVYENAIQTQRWNARKEVFKWEHVFLADLSVEDYYRMKINLDYDCNTTHDVRMAFLDIESDIYGLSSSELAANIAPTNAVTIIFTHNLDGEKIPQVYTFLLRDHKRYPQQEEFEENFDEMMKLVHENFDEIEITRKGKKKIIKTNFQYHVSMFDSETELTLKIFETINKYMPDICGIWNIEYDIPQLYYRMRHLGLDPVQVMSHPIFPKDARFVNMNIDHRGAVTAAERKTYVKMTSLTRYICQMLSYASIRKGRKSYGSDALDNIAEVELGIHKREFSHGADISNAAIKDYVNFFLYSINDVVLQFLIEQVTMDLVSLFVDENQANCAYENLAKQTKYNKQFFFHKIVKRGYIPGCNINIDYLSDMSEDKVLYLNEMNNASKRRKALDAMVKSGELDESDLDISLIDDSDIDSWVVSEVDKSDIYSDSIKKKLEVPGAIIGHPNLNSRCGTELVDGVNSKHVFDHVMDFDFAAEYPKAKITRSISRSTQYGRLIINGRISEKQNTYNNPQYIAGSEFVSDYISGDIISMGNVWFDLPDTDEMSKIIEKELRKQNKEKDDNEE